MSSMNNQEGPPRRNVFKAMDRLARHGWLPIIDVAQILGVTANHLYQQEDPSKGMNAIRVGREYRVNEEDILILLQTKIDKGDENAPIILELYQGIKRNVESLCPPERGS